jgi:hypothetical protein
VTLTEGRKEVVTMVAAGGQQEVCLYPLLYLNNAQLELRILRIRADGWLELRGLEGKVQELSIDELAGLVREGRVQTKLREEESLYIRGLAWFNAVNVVNTLENGDLLKEVEDIIHELNNEPTSSDICRSAFAEYQQNPSESNRLRLKEAYEQVPGQLHCWLLGFPEKDAPILNAIGDRVP